MVKSWDLGEDAALQMVQRYNTGDTRRQSKSSL